MAKTGNNQDQDIEWLNWICAAEDIDELKEKYDQWADTYDEQVQLLWSQVPKAAARIFTDHIADKNSLLIDVGAGTGLGGVALAEQGFKNIIGCDVSQAMLEKAREKQVYQSLVCCAIGDEAAIDLGKASGLMALGVFSANHAGADELISLEQNLLPGGIIVFTSRSSFLPKLEQAMKQHAWQTLSSIVIPIYEDPIHLLTCKIDHNSN